MENSNNMFPVFLKIEELDVLLVGGGNVGQEKLEALLKNAPGAHISVVADYIKDEVKLLASRHSGVELINRKFQFKDLEGKDLVILGTDSRELHESIKKETRKRRILTNVADTPDLCDFYLGSVVQKGDLKIAISTNGKSPTLAKRMREFLEELLPDSIQGILDNLKHIRDNIKGDFKEKIRVLDEVTSVMNKEKKNGTSDTSADKK